MLITQPIPTHTMSPPKPWSVATFERERSYMTRFVLSDIQPLLDSGDCRRMVIRAPVKSGKREMVEYIAIRDYQSKGQQHCVHAFLSAFHRNADKDQRLEIAAHGIKVFSIINKKKGDEVIQWIRQQLRDGKVIVLHIDECDHGSGERQQLSAIWREIKDNVWVTAILYSATPEEIRFSGEVDEVVDEFVQEGYYIEFTPPDGYCGPGKYLSEGLVSEAEPFFHKEGEGYVISQQGKQIIGDLIESMKTNPTRNIVILRLTYGMEGGKKGKDNKASHTFIQNLQTFEELKEFIIIGDKGEKFIKDNRSVPSNFISENIDWSKRVYWERQTTAKPVLILVDQTSSRSTEWACHDRVFATHDYRKAITFGPCSQAQERPNHYSSKYPGGFQPIRIYGSIKTFQLSAGYITYEEFLQITYRKQKVDRRRAGDRVVYEIKSNEDNSIHPEYTQPVSEQEADEILFRVGCLIEPTLSTRVKGRVKRVQKIDCEFKPCTRETFSIPRMQNPFIKSGEEMARFPEKYVPDGGQIGFLRCWKVWTYDEVVDNINWGFSVSSTTSRSTICYKDGVLGVAIRTPTNDIVTVNGLTSFKSMYGDR